MARFLRTKSLYYNDVNLIASKGVVVTRREVPRELHRIIVAPMAAIQGKTFIHKACELGISVIVHRFQSVDSQVDIFNEVKNKSPHIWCAIGLKNEGRLEALLKNGCRNFLLDVANGYSEATLQFLSNFLEKNKVDKVMSGNIHTATGFSLLEAVTAQSPLSLVRVGIGNGAACLTTKQATGFGRGQVTELLECYEYKSDNNSSCQIIADGGIKNAADANKAFGCGANYVMMGSYFSKAKEAETHIIGDGTYWGGASHKQQSLYGEVRPHEEGTVLPIKDELFPLEDLVEKLWMSIASAISYSGKTTLTDFIGNGVFEIRRRTM